LATGNIQTIRIDDIAQSNPADDAARLITAIRALAPEIAARSKEIEDGRRVPGDIAVTLRRLGLFRSALAASS
jgi:hypothetical protein